MRAYRDAQALVRWTGAALVLSIATTLASLGVDAYAALVLLTPVGAVDADALSDAGSLYEDVQLILGLTSLPAIVLFIVWLRRAYRNAEALGGPRRYARGQVIWSWFVPVLNLFRPKQLVDEAWRPSEAALGASRAPLRRWWWALWVASLMVSVVGAVLAPDLGGSGVPEQAPRLRRAVIAEALAYLLSVPTGVLAILIVRRLAADQRRHARAGAAAFGAAPEQP